MFAIRDLEPADVPLVLDSWSRSWRVSPWAGTIPNNLFHEVHRSTVEGLIARGATVKVLCVEAKPDSIVGWVCYEVERSGKTVIHYMYVKDPYAVTSPEFARRLLAATEGEKPGFYSHRTKKIVDALGASWRWAPEIARRK